MTTSATLAVDTRVRSRVRREGPDVWDRLWRHRPPEVEDEAAIESEARSTRWGAILRRIEETFGRVDGLRTIELGSGRGDASILLARRGARVTLVDYSDRALSEARRRFERCGLQADFVRADLLGRLQGLVGGFDVSVSFGVAEHFKGADRRRAIEAHRRVVGDAGLAIISVPHAACPSYRVWKLCLETRGWWPYGMEIPYSRGEITRYARWAGFARVETRAFGFWQSVAQHACKGILGLRVGGGDRVCLLDNALGAALVMFGWT